MKEEIVEILVEEQSIKNVLELILPEILPAGYELNSNCFIRPHQGKSDLKKSIPKKVSAFKNNYPFPVKLIIVHDQDSNDCKKLKTELIELVTSINKDQPHLVRIACKELENWYLGDMQAIEAVYPSFKAERHKNKAKYRNPDNIFGAFELEQLIKDFSKGFASRQIPQHMKLDQNTSVSFNHFLNGIRNFLSN